MNKQRGSITIVALIMFACWLLAIGGWVANIVKLVGMNFNDPISTWLVLRVAGIPIAPLGMVLGYL